MFGNAVKRCQATPIVGVSAMATNHAIDTTILAVATSRTPLRSGVADQPVEQADQRVRHPVRRSRSRDAVGGAAQRRAAVRMSTAMARTVAST